MVTLFPREKGRTVVFGTGQDIMLVWLIAPAFDQFSVFIHRRAFDQIGHDMQLIKIGGNQITVGIVPRALSDPIPGRQAAPFFHLCGKISPPRTALGTRHARQLCAMGITPCHPAQIGPVPNPDTGDKETHGMIRGQRHRTGE